MRYGKSIVLAGLVVGVMGLTTGEITSPVQAQSLVQNQTEADQLLQQGIQHLKAADYQSAENALKRALEVYRQTKNLRGEAQTLTQLGEVYNWSDRNKEALATLQSALKLWRELKDRQGEGRSLHQIGEAYNGLNELQKARESLQQGLKIQQGIGDRQGEGRSLVTLGVIEFKSKQPKLGLERLQQAQAILQKTDDRTWESLAESWIGWIQVNTNNVAEGLVHLERGLKLSRAAGDRRAEFVALYFTASAYSQQKNYAKALEIGQKLLTIAIDPTERGQVYDLIGQTHHTAKQYPQAREAFQQALAIYQQVNKLPQQANTLLSIGYAYLFEGIAINEQKNFMGSRKLYEQSLKPLQEGLDIARKIPDRRLESNLLTTLGQSYGKQAGTFSVETKYQQALELELQGLQFLEKGLAVTKEIKDFNENKRIQYIIAVQLNSIVQYYRSLKQYNLLLKTNQRIQDFAKEIQNPKLEQWVLSNELNMYSDQVNFYDNPQQYAKRLEAAQKVIVLAQKLNQPNQEILATLFSANVYRFWGQYSKALELYQQGLNRARESKRYKLEVLALQSMGLTYDYQAKYAQAIATYQQAVQVSRQQNLLVNEVNALNNIATIYEAQGKYADALKIQEQNLILSRQIYNQFSKGITSENIQAVCLDKDFREVGTAHNIDAAMKNKVFNFFEEQCNQPTNSFPPYIRKMFKDLIHDKAKSGQNSIGNTFINIGAIYSGQGDYPKAIEFYEKALAIARELHDFNREAGTLNNLGTVYQSQGNLAKATEMFKQALKIAVERGDRSSEILYRRNLGSVQEDAGRFTEAMKGYEQMLALARQFGQPSQEAHLLDAIGISHASQGQYGEALTYFQESLKIRQDIGEVGNMAMTITSIAGVYNRLGSFQRAQEYLQQALTIAQQIGDRGMEPTLYFSIAAGDREQGQLVKALSNLQKSLAVARSIGKLLDESSALSGIGRIYLKQSQPTKALEVLQQALKIQQQTGVIVSQDDTLSLIGEAYIQLGDYNEAQTTLQKSLAIATETNDRATRGKILSSLGDLLAKQNQPELAIAFYKQSVNTYEQIRADIQKLPLEQQASYTQTVAITYRNLADLLLQQNRTIEALQVLDLLKVQDLQDFLKDVKGNPLTAKGIELLPQETAILQTFNTSPQRSLTAFLQNPTVRNQVQVLKQTAVEQNLKSSAYQDLQTRMKKLGKNIALFYPLILDDRLELVILTRDRPPIRKPVAISRQQLETEVQTFRQQLEGRSPLIQRSAQQLYQHLMQPLDGELKAAGVETIIYAPDGIMRYVPLAALYDGTQWLIQRYQINYLTALALTPLDPPNQRSTKVMAGALTRPYSVTVAGTTFRFSGLDFTRPEVERIAQTVPNTTALIDQEFNRKAIEGQMAQVTLIHLATHAAFLPNSPDASFVLLGDGSTISLKEIAAWKLPNLSLFVLSACQTALGGKLGSGIEILGFGYQMQRTGSRAAIASLWKVDDGGTQALMNAFYAALQRGMTKVQALQEAQKAVITGNYSVVGGQRSDINMSTTGRIEVVPLENSVRLSHPYYWAPFILIGNGL